MSNNFKALQWYLITKEGIMSKLPEEGTELPEEEAKSEGKLTTKEFRACFVVCDEGKPNLLPMEIENFSRDEYTGGFKYKVGEYGGRLERKNMPTEVINLFDNEIKQEKVDI